MQVSNISGIQNVNTNRSSFKGVKFVLNKDTLLMKDCINELKTKKSEAQAEMILRDFENGIDLLTKKVNGFINFFAGTHNTSMSELWPETTEIKISPDYNFDWSQLPYRVSAKEIATKEKPEVLINTFTTGQNVDAENVFKGIIKFLNNGENNIKPYIRNLLQERPFMVEQERQNKALFMGK